MEEPREPNCTGPALVVCNNPAGLDVEDSLHGAICEPANASGRLNPSSRVRTRRGLRTH
jgi:hypothetical protein